MSVYIVFEHDVPKGKDAQKEYRTWVVEKLVPFSQKMQKEGVFKGTGLADNTGHIMGIWEFEDTDAFAKLWNDEDYHAMMRSYYSVAENIKIRLCRPSVVIPP